MMRTLRSIPTVWAVSFVITACGSADAPSSSAAPLVAVPAAELREVAVAELVVGNAPEKLAEAMRLTPGAIVEGERVWVLASAEADGMSWDLVVADRRADEPNIPFGWVSSDLDGAPSLRPASLACPSPPLSVEEAMPLAGFGGLACFGAAPIEIIGFTPLGCGAGGSPRVGTPDWLSGTWTVLGIGNRAPMPPNFEVDASISARAAPALAGPPGCDRPGWFRFIGHFDDPASSTCRTETVDGVVPVVVEQRLSELICRSQLVVTDAIPADGQP
jgi:hypothetical protein